MADANHEMHQALNKLRLGKIKAKYEKESRRIKASKNEKKEGSRGRKRGGRGQAAAAGAAADGCDDDASLAGDA